MTDATGDIVGSDDIWVVRRRLDELVGARLQPGWGAGDERVYLELAQRERILLAAGPTP
jgi:hypothetical protein